MGIAAASGLLLRAEGSSRWGTSGANGGTAIVTADSQALVGNMPADGLSSIALTLRNGATLTGSIDSTNAAKSASVTLDASSSWTLTADSHVTTLSDSAGISGTSVTNITGNGHTLCYNSASNSSLGGKTYTLTGSGTLTPGS